MSKEQEKTNLEWVMKETGATQLQNEAFNDKFKRKVLENPFVPIGCFTTAGILMYGLWAFKSGDSKMSQLMMRYRIAAQGFTIAAVVTGVLLSAKHLEKKENTQ